MCYNNYSKGKGSSPEHKGYNGGKIMKNIKFERSILEWCINFDLESLECFYTTTDWIIENINKELAEYVAFIQM